MVRNYIDDDENSKYDRLRATRKKSASDVPGVAAAWHGL